MVCRGEKKSCRERALVPDMSSAIIFSCRICYAAVLFAPAPHTQVTWIGIGGFVFFGVYEGAKTQLMGLGV